MMSQALFALDSAKNDHVNNNQCEYWKFAHNGQDISAKSEGVCVGSFVYNRNGDRSLRDGDTRVASTSDTASKSSDQEQCGLLACKEIPKGRFSNIEDGLESSVSLDAKCRINKILDDVKSLTDVEKLLLYLKLPNGATGGEDAYRKTPTSCLHASNRIEQAQAFRWIKSHLEEDVEICVPKQEVFQDYRMYCESHSIGVLSTADFGKVMKCVFPNVKPRRLGQRGQSKYCYGGLRKKMSDQPPTLPEIELRPRTFQDDADDASELFLSSCQLVCEWAEKLLGTSFDGGVCDLAEYLVSNLYVNSKSVAAFTIIAAMQESGLHHSKVSSLFSSKSGGDSHREMQLQLQRKITERELRKEQQQKVQIQREENESELGTRDGSMLISSSSPHRVLLSPMKKTCHLQKRLVPPLVINKHISAECLSPGSNKLMPATYLTGIVSQDKQKSSESDDSMIQYEVGEEDNVFDNMHVAEPPLAVRLEQIQNAPMKVLKHAALEFTPFILQTPTVIPDKRLDIQQRMADEEDENTDACSSNMSNTIVQSLDRLKYVILNPSPNEQCLSGELTNIASDKILLLDSSRSAFIPFSQTVQSRGEQHSLPSVQSYPSSELMICENSEDTVDIDDVMNKHDDEYPAVSHSIKLVMSDSMSLPDDPIMSMCARKNQISPSTPRKAISRFTPIRPKAVQTILKEQQGHKHDGLDSRPVSKILKERRAKEAQAEVLAQISTSLQSQNALSFPSSLKLTGPMSNRRNVPRDVIQLPLGMAGKEMVIILNAPGSAQTPATILSPVKTTIVPFSAANISQSNPKNISYHNVNIQPVSVPTTVSSKSGPCVSANESDCVSDRVVVVKKSSQHESRSQSAKMEQNAQKDLNSSNNLSRPSSACSRDADTPSFCRKRKSSDKGGNSLVPKRMNSLDEKGKDGQAVWSEDAKMDKAKVIRQTKSCTRDLGDDVEEIPTITVKETQFCPDISSVESDALLDSTLNIDSITTSSAQEINAMHKVQTTSVGVSAKSLRSSQTRLLKQKQLLDERMKSFLKKGSTSLRCANSKLSKSKERNPDWFTKYSTPTTSFSDMVQTMKDSNIHQVVSQMEVEGLIENPNSAQTSMQLSPKSQSESENELPEDVADFITEAMAANESQRSSSLDQRPFDLAEWHLALPSSFSDKEQDHLHMKKLTNAASDMPYAVENVNHKKINDKFTVPAVPPKQDANQLQRLLHHGSDPQKKRCISLPSFNKPCHTQDQRSVQTPFSFPPAGKDVAYLQSQTLSPSQTSPNLSVLQKYSAVNQVNIKVMCADQQNLSEKKPNNFESSEQIIRYGNIVSLTQHVATTMCRYSSPSDEKSVASGLSTVGDKDKNNELLLESGFISPIQPVQKYPREPTVDQGLADVSIGIMNHKRRTPVEQLENTQFSPGICPVRRKREMSLDRLSNQTPLSDAGYHSIGASPILNSTPVSSGNTDSTFNSTNNMSSISTRSELTQSSVNDTVSESPGLPFAQDPQASTPLPFIYQNHVQETRIQSPVVSPGASAFMPIHSTSQTINRYVTPIRPIVTVANTVISSLPNDISEQECSPDLDKTMSDVENKLPAEKNDEAVLSDVDLGNIPIGASVKYDDSYCSTVESKTRRFKDPPSYESAVGSRKESRITEYSSLTHHSSKSKSVLSCILEQTDTAQKTNIPVISKDVSGNDSSDSGTDKTAPLSELSSAFPFSYKLAMLSNQTVVKKTPPSESILAKLVASERDQLTSKINSQVEEGKDCSNLDFSSSKLCEMDSEEENCSLTDTVPGDCTIIHHHASTDSNQSQQPVVSSRPTKDDRQSTAGCILSTVDINGVTRVFYNSEVSIIAKTSADVDADSPKSTTSSVSPKSNIVLLPVAVTANLHLKNVQSISKYTKNVVLPSVNYIGSAPNIDIRNVLDTPSKSDNPVRSSFEEERVFTVRKDLSDVFEESSSINEEELQTTLEDLRSLDGQYFDQNDFDLQVSRSQTGINLDVGDNDLG